MSTNSDRQHNERVVITEQQLRAARMVLAAANAAGMVPEATTPTVERRVLATGGANGNNGGEDGSPLTDNTPLSLNEGRAYHMDAQKARKMEREKDDFKGVRAAIKRAVFMDYKFLTNGDLVWDDDVCKLVFEALAVKIPQKHQWEQGDRKGYKNIAKSVIANARTGATSNIKNKFLGKFQE